MKVINSVWFFLSFAKYFTLVLHWNDLGDIIPPPAIRESMEMQAEAERKKRAEIIEAEGMKTFAPPLLTKSQCLL